MLIIPQTSELPAAVHAFTTTRVFPTSCHAANLHDSSTSWPSSMHPKGAALEHAFAQHDAPLTGFLPSAPVWLHQVHGNAVAAIDQANLSQLRQTPLTADAAFTRTPGAVLAILTADCLPVVIADTEGTTLSAAHAGWRGLAAGILEATVERMNLPPENLVAWLGPAIGPHAFEVGADVFEAFGAGTDPEIARCFAPSKPGHWLADLPELARLRLQRMGIVRISGGTWCTYSDKERFFSYRRQKDEGRMATFAWLGPDR